MPRNSTRPEVILGMTASATARALSIRPEKVGAALDAGHLVARQLDGRGKKIIPVFGPMGIQAWYESWPLAKRK